MRETFRAELRDLKMEVLLIGRIINGMTRDAAAALVNGDLDLVDKVFKIEDEVDRRCLGVEERSLEIIATQFPVARDLRLIYSLSYIAMHMERMGDLAVNIAKAARRTASRKGPQTLYDLIQAQANLVNRVLEAMVDALDRYDVELARKLQELDEPIDHLFKQFFRELARLTDEEDIEWASAMVLASRYLERIADNAVDIGERITYLVTGDFDGAGEQEEGSAMGAIAERYEAVRRQVVDAADIAGRDPGRITIVAVTKTVGVEEVRQAIDAGIHEFGENRVQEFEGKRALFPRERWHFIGTLQGNKVKDVVGKAYLIHSVDSIKLLRSVDRHAQALGCVQPVLLEVNVSGEASKHGLSEHELPDVLQAASALPHVTVRGLMTLAPFVRPEEARWVFRELASLSARLQSQHYRGVDLRELSMGMTNDFRVAVEEGATIVRVGRAIFGK